MVRDYLLAYQSINYESEKIQSTKINKVSYLLKLKAQRNSIYDIDKIISFGVTRNYLIIAFILILKLSSWCYY